ncbi:hypothetical protein M406DRAFT_326200 [Cryphonectria parasitica EP155]|uniref:Uncharacterized protein n=1 Tax=Cryphonectria parasitica (strain ATCC 38755 / EP155) TaxID=660469 RepID=A0A9P4YCD8_CRYP1|nr:uncharacterized protein M406DRAFT_326200 [Cryphonectria parasitica EP155]KAF3770776.1 hypothetical protein M406DRAFT_326200 [Cryphonectria parasitica EP155]
MSPIPPVNATWTSFNTTTPMAQGSNESPWAMDLSTLVQIVFGVLGIIKTAVNFFYNRSKIQGVMLGLGTGRQAPDQNLAHDECKICNRPASVSTARSIDSGKYLWSQSETRIWGRQAFEEMQIFGGSPK